MNTRQSFKQVTLLYWLIEFLHQNLCYKDIKARRSFNTIFFFMDVIEGLSGMMREATVINMHRSYRIDGVEVLR